MPTKPNKPCAHPGCPELIQGGHFCDRHLKQDRKNQDLRRGSARDRGYNSRWDKYRRSYLKKHPFCRKCEEQNWITVAVIVDHIIPHRGDYDLFWDPTNHQALCKRCHDIKTAKEDGGFGNKQK